MGICLSATTGMTTTVSKHEYDGLHCGISTVFTQTATKNLLDRNSVSVFERLRRLTQCTEYKESPED